jgi:hypothetical protein
VLILFNDELLGQGCGIETETRQTRRHLHADPMRPEGRVCEVLCIFAIVQTTGNNAPNGNRHFSLQSPSGRHT